MNGVQLQIIREPVAFFRLEERMRLVEPELFARNC